VNLSTIEVPQAEAIRLFRDYRAAVRGRHSEEDAQLMRGFRELAAGRRLIDLPRVLREGGTVAHGRGVMPALAVCRAEASVCTGRLGWDGGAWFAGHAESVDGPRIRSGVTADYVVLSPGTFERPGEATTAEAVVPIVPPALRPARGLAGYHVLWEAEWRRVAPRDPALLKHIGGDLWAVLAVWDLTELERTVLMGRFR
jgi:hypothetical protein